MELLLYLLVAFGLLFSLHQMYKHRHFYDENPRLKVVYLLLIAFWLALIGYLFFDNLLWAALAFCFLIAHWLFRQYSTRKSLVELKSTLDSLDIAPTADPTADKTNFIPDEFTALTQACANGDFRIVKELVAAGIDIENTNDDWSPLMHAISNGHSETSLYLIDAGANVNAREKGIRDENAMSPIALAVEGHMIPVAEALLEKGADPYLFAPENYTLADQAEEDGNAELVELLGKHGLWPLSMLDDDGSKI